METLAYYFNEGELFSVRTETNCIPRIGEKVTLEKEDTIYVVQDICHVKAESTEHVNIYVAEDNH